MAVHKMDPNNPDPEGIRNLMGPGQVDHSVQQAIHFCWMMLPTDRRSIDGLEREFRRIVDRAFRNMREDEKSFGTGR